MQRPDFYDSILPPIGLRVLAVFKGGLSSAPTHYFYDSNDDLLAAADTYDKLGKNVYHACSAYKEDANRKGDNVLAIKCLWADLDVGANKPHATLQDAVSSISKFVKATGLHIPHYVTSGNGLHAYWPFDKAILPEQWDRLAALFASVMDHAGVLHDTSRTQDKASILRIPGTNNYKTTPAKPVTLLRAGAQETAQAIYGKLKKYADANGVSVATSKAKPASAPSMNSELVGTKDYPPSYGKIVANKCAVLGEVESTGGDVSYDIWWRAMGVAKHLADAPETAIKWTSNRHVTHDKYDWQGTIDTWNAGPTTCVEFAKHSDKCKTCKFSGTISSPIVLGGNGEPVVDLVPLPPPPPERVWTYQADWVLAELVKKKMGVSRGKYTMEAIDADGNKYQTPFCNRYWQIMDRVRGTDGTWQLQVAYTVYPDKPHETFLLECASVTSPDLFRKAFSAREIHISGGPKAMNAAQEIAKWHQEMLTSAKQETRTYPTMGWVTADNTPRGELTGEFVLGTTKFAPKLEPVPALLGSNVPATLNGDFGTAGTLAEWTDKIDRIYNRPGAEPYQFLICAMLAAPLVRLTSGGSWHGIPIALVGKTGAAKTTTASMAASIYGSSSRFTFNLGASQGDTINGFCLKVGVMNNLPFVADEMTGREPEFVESVMYMLANGQMKDRMAPNAQMIPNPYRWDTLSIITSNESLHAKLKELRNQNVQDATRFRCFEINLNVEEIARVFHDITAAEFDQFAATQYGVVGRSWVQALVNGRNKITKFITDRRGSYKIDELDSSDARFYKDLLLITECAAVIAQSRGLIQWNISAMMDWAKSNLRSLRDGVRFKDWDSTCSDFVASLHGKTIVTKNFKLGQGRRSAHPEIPLEQIGANTVPVARRAIEDKLFVVTVNYLNSWAAEMKIPLAEFTSALRRLNYFVERDGKEQRLISIGSGTTVARPQALCYELNFSRVESASSDGEEKGGNVVELRSPAADEPASSESTGT